MDIKLDGVFVADEVAKTISSTPQALTDLGFTTDQIAYARAALITVETNSIRYRIGTPTASNGHLIAAGDGGWVPGALSALKLIRTGSDATVTVSLWR